MTISFLITACTEHIELSLLLLQLSSYVDNSREIVVLLDEDKVTKEVEIVANSYVDILPRESYRVERYPLNNDFASFKNYGNGKCSKEWIIQLDADELFHRPELIESLPKILKENGQNVDLILIPRINTVHGITLEHIRKWGWSISKLEEVKNSEVVEFSDPYFKLLNSYNLVTKVATMSDSPERATISYNTPIINFPDYQTRIYRNSSEIKWEGAVHERITGHKRYAPLPMEAAYCLLHAKDITKQEAQNNYYATIGR